MSADTPLTQLIQDVRESLIHLKENGCTGFDCSAETVDTLSKMGVPIRQPDNTPQPATDEKESLNDIRMDLGDCKRCPLCRTRNHIVFGEGDENARLVFVGEGPGFAEDRSGHPFVGKAGELLTKIIRAMNLSRDKVYIANIVKCRPPNNRNPERGEIEECLPFLKRQLEAINAEIICALGSVAAKTLLRTDLPISRLRGKFHEMEGTLVMPTFHPAFLLRNPERKRDVWNDVQQIMKKLDLLLTHTTR
jgi:uracil-DNA glycosylase family 4